MPDTLSKAPSLPKKRSDSMINAAETLANWRCDKHSLDEPQAEATLKALTYTHDPTIGTPKGIRARKHKMPKFARLQP